MGSLLHAHYYLKLGVLKGQFINTDNISSAKELKNIENTRAISRRVSCDNAIRNSLL